MALSGRIRDAGRCRRGGGTPQRKKCAETRLEAGKVRKRKKVSDQPKDYDRYNDRYTRIEPPLSILVAEKGLE